MSASVAYPLIRKPKLPASPATHLRVAIHPSFGSAEPNTKYTMSLLLGSDSAATPAEVLHIPPKAGGADVSKPEIVWISRLAP